MFALPCEQIDVIANMKINNKQEKLLRLQSVLDFQQREAICALSGLLNYLTKSGIKLAEKEGLGRPISFKSLQTIDMKSVVHIDNNSMRALSIFVDDEHPGHSTSKKEGLSVFALINQTKTSAGGAKLRGWLKFPSRDINVIRARQNHIAFFLAPENADLTGELRNCLSHIKVCCVVIFHSRTRNFVVDISFLC